jgi:transglutaminase-like putative cysteine protease
LRKFDQLRASALLSYTALLGSVAAIAAEAPVPSVVFFALAFLLGLLVDLKVVPGALFRPLWIVPLVLFGIVLSLTGINEEIFINRILSVLLVIISAKLILPKRQRDLLQLYLLNLLVTAGAAVVRWGLEFGLLVILETFLSVTGLVLIYGSQEQQEISASQARQLFRVSTLITALLIPATVILFLIIPRPTGMFFAWGARSFSQSGFGDRVSPGAVADIKADPSPAFRVKWLKGEVPKRPLWRGRVYDTYHEGAWEKRYHRQVNFPDLEEDTVEYEVLLEPTDLKYLLSLGLPSEVRIKPLKTSLVAGYTLQVSEAIHRRILYQVEAYALSDFPQDLRVDIFLNIEEALKERLVPLARGVAGKTVIETAGAVENFLKSGFGYTLSPGEVDGDPVLHFLFTTKKGHCEYFASAMVLLLRSLNIPSRIVAGYAGGEWNELGQYFLVRQSDAHTWVEVWIEDRGWVSFDPTPGVPATEGSSLRARLLRYLDLLRYKWYFWVLDYDLSRQIDLARKTASVLQSLRTDDFRNSLSFKLPPLKTLLPLAMLGALVVCFILAWSLFRRQPATLGEQFVRVFERHGYAKHSWETLREFARRIAEGHKPLEEKAVAFVEAYYLWEYGREGSRERLPRLLREVAGMVKEGKH